MLRKRILSIVIVVLVMAVGSVLLAARSFGRRVENATPHTAPILSVPVQEARISDSDQKGMWLMVGPYGFVVKEWAIPAGEYFVVIQNATGLKELSLTLDRQNGERVQEIQLPGTKRLWKQKLQLARGTYIVKEAAHPEWTSRITVE